MTSDVPTKGVQLRNVVTNTVIRVNQNTDRLCIDGYAH